MELLNSVINPQGGDMTVGGMSIKDYFLRIRELYKRGEKYPVNLDEVWPLIYSRRDKAIAALIENFMPDDDYMFASSKGEAKRGGLNKRDYYLSAGCLEYYIAKKVKAVFDIYSQIFHKAADAAEKPMTLGEIALLNAQNYVIQERRQSELENRMKQLETRTSTTPDVITVVGFSIEHEIKNVTFQQSQALGRRSSSICRKEGITIDKIKDPHWGKIGMYPTRIVAQAYKEIIGYEQS